MRVVSHLILGLVLSFLFFCSVAAQQTDWEKFLESEKETAESSELLEKLEQLREHPLDVNRANLKMLLTIPGMRPTVARSIVALRRKHKLVNLEEIPQNITLTPDEWRWLRQFLVIRVPSPRTRQFSLKFRSRVFQRLEKARGFQRAYYQGSPVKLYHRLHVVYPPLKGSLVLEKDSGERNWNDLTVFYLENSFWQDRLRFIFGHYHLGFGQGLVFWTPYAFAKGGEPIFPTKKVELPVEGNRSTSETELLRGAVAYYHSSKFSLLTFYSDSRWDATLTNGKAQTIAKTGLHRTATEMAKRDQLREKLYGGHVTKQFKEKLCIGLSFYQSYFQPELMHSSKSADYFRFWGSRNQVGGMNIDYLFTRGMIFGEIAACHHGGKAGLIGAIFDYHAVQLSTLFRYYGREFQNLHAHGFGESDDTCNEIGHYFGLRYRPFRKSQFWLYFDQFRQPWCTATKPMPSSGYEWLFQWQQKFFRGFSIIVRIREKTKEHTETVTLDQIQRTPQIPFSRRTYRGQWEMRVSPRLRLRGRVEWIVVAPRREGAFDQFVHREKGILLFQDCYWQPISSLTLRARWTLFDTDSYNSRLYQFESDLYGVMSNKALYGKGSRWYTVVRWKWTKLSAISLKYATTYFVNRQTIGSGYEQIDSNTDHWISVQLDAGW